VLDVDGSIDLAVIGIRATLVPKAIEDCRTKGVKAAVIVTGGFAEAGKEGEELQDKVIKTAGDMRIVGPNTIGIVNLSHNLNVSFLRPLKGPLALISQGGNVVNEVEHIAHRKGIGFSQIIDPSNQADVSLCEFLEYIQDDPATKAILMYIEGFREGEGRQFMRIARQITKTKPIIAVKVGVTQVGARAARSHTTSLAGTDAIYDAVFKQAGVIRVRDSQELVDVADALVRLPRMMGNRIGMLVDGGSHATMACDAASTYGLELPALAAQTQENLKGVLLPHSQVSNPVDFAGAMDADVRVLSKAANLILQDENVDGLMIAGINFGGYSRWFGVVDLEKEAAYNLAGMPAKYDKPILLHNSVLSEETPALQIIDEGGIPLFSDVERAAECMAALARYSLYLKQCEEES
jgi:acetyltransferase